MKEISFVHNEKEYKLRFNMNVMADVSEEYNGDLSEAFTNEGRIIKASLTVLAAMMNDYADEMGWPERFTANTLGRELKSPEDIPISEITALIIDGTVNDGEEKVSSPEESVLTEE